MGDVHSAAGGPSSLREATGGLATARRPHFYAQRGSRSQIPHQANCAGGSYARSRAASPSPIHRLATAKEQPQLDRGAQCCADPRVSQRLRLLPSAGKQAED